MDIGELRDMIKDLPAAMQVINYDPQSNASSPNPQNPRPDCWGIDETETRVRPMIRLDGASANEFQFNDRMPKLEQFTLDLIGNLHGKVVIKADGMFDNDIELAFVIRT